MPSETSRPGSSGSAGLSPDSLTQPEPPACSHPATDGAGGHVSARGRSDGGPAFPSPSVNGLAPVPPVPGMSLRDYFAATVPVVDYMDIAIGEAIMGTRCPLVAESPLGAFEWLAALQARVRYRYADAMLAARGAGMEPKQRVSVLETVHGPVRGVPATVLNVKEGARAMLARPHRLTPPDLRGALVTVLRVRAEFGLTWVVVKGDGWPECTVHVEELDVFPEAEGGAK